MKDYTFLELHVLKQSEDLAFNLEIVAMHQNHANSMSQGFKTTVAIASQQKCAQAGIWWAFENQTIDKDICFRH